MVGLNSLDEAQLGLDDSIKWTVKDGRKVSGTLTTWVAEDTEKTYDLCNVDPVIHYFDIRGPASQCWSVIDPSTGTQYLVKDCWKVDDRVPEYTYLETAQGLPGVVQMVSFEANRGETKSFRDNVGISHVDFHNRVGVRIVLDSYGESITKFRSPMELLCALRDAIGGEHFSPSVDSILPN